MLVVSPRGCTRPEAPTVDVVIAEFLEWVTYEPRPYPDGHAAGEQIFAADENGRYERHVLIRGEQFADTWLLLAELNRPGPKPGRRFEIRDDFRLVSGNRLALEPAAGVDEAALQAAIAETTPEGTLQFSESLGWFVEFETPSASTLAEAIVRLQSLAVISRADWIAYDTRELPKPPSGLFFSEK